MASINIADSLTTAVESYFLSSSSEFDVFPYTPSTWALVRTPNTGINENFDKNGQGLLIAAFNITCTAAIGGLSAECPPGMHAALRNCIISDGIILKILSRIRFKELRIDIDKPSGVKLSGAREQFGMLVAGIWHQTTSFASVCDWVNEAFGSVIEFAIGEYRKLCLPKQSSAPKEFVLLQRIHDFQVAKADLQRANIDAQIREVQNSPVLATNQSEDVHEYFRQYSFVFTTGPSTEHTEASFESLPPLNPKTLAPTTMAEVASNLALSGLLPPLVLETSTPSSSALTASNVTPPSVGDSLKVAQAPFEDAINDRLPAVCTHPLAQATVKDQLLPIKVAAKDSSPPAETTVKDSLLLVKHSVEDVPTEFDTTAKGTPPSPRRKSPITPRNFGDYRWPTPLRHNAPPPHIPSPLRSSRNSNLSIGFHPHSLLSYRQTSPQSCVASSTSSATIAPSSPPFCFEDYLRMSPRGPYLPVDPSLQSSNVQTFSQWLKSSPL
ncbi:hypothetical protein R3P38DRAFT_3339149 [Favolaschia claudopus]|uniref:Uncharacterized protein n=1 Tax=Favolaschia claudopus TaxID=2862362 RepID=A0AAW0EDC2_9AGAR